MANSLINGGLAISGEKTVAATGTAEALVGSQSYFGSVTIIAKSGNTGNVYIGGSDVDTSTNDGLKPGESITLAPRPKNIDLAEIYLDVDTNGEGVDFYAVK